MIQTNVSLRPFTTLRAGGAAERFTIVRTHVHLCAALAQAQAAGPVTILGWGSNVLPSDAGVPGLTIRNEARKIEILADGEVVADSGCGFQELFLKAAQAGLAGLEFAVGIPGTLGGALVSNAGAYRSAISKHLVEIEIVHEGQRKWVRPGWMEFSYRNSVLRRANPPNAAITRVRLRLETGNPVAIYDAAREFQRQRISKQPPSPSAGSFFKNVEDQAFAESLDQLPVALKAAGVTPAGYLIEAVGLKGHQIGGARVGVRHANFILNVGGASATDIRRLAEKVAKSVFDRFGVQLEEEVLYLGDWSGFRPD